MGSGQDMRSCSGEEGQLADEIQGTCISLPKNLGGH